MARRIDNSHEIDKTRQDNCKSRGTGQTGGHHGGWARTRAAETFSTRHGGQSKRREGLTHSLSCEPHGTRGAGMSR